MESFVGRDIGKYHITEQLGEGGMAVVYKAFDTSLERFVAIKFIRKEAVGEDYYPQLLKRFEREAKILASLNHPNIVNIHDYGQYQGSPYLVEEYIPGGELRTEQQPMPYIQAANLLAPIARALEYAHHRGVVHRDIKPSNILICETGAPMLSDFGIAKILNTESFQGTGSSRLTSTGMQIGTPEYMAPEQWQGEPVAQSDIYALGVVLYELLTGRVPYTATTPAAVMIKQITEPLPHPRQFVKDLPEGVEGVIFKALALNVENRYASMGEFAAALESLGHKEVVHQPLVKDAGQARPEVGRKDRHKATERVAADNKQIPVIESGSGMEKTTDHPVIPIRTIQVSNLEPFTGQAVDEPPQRLEEKETSQGTRGLRALLHRPIWLAIGGAGLLGLILLGTWLISNANSNSTKEQKVDFTPTIQLAALTTILPSETPMLPSIATSTMTAVSIMTSPTSVPTTPAATATRALTFVQWGSQGSGNGQLSFPSGIAVDEGGNIFVVDTANDRIQKFSSDGNYITQWGGHWVRWSNQETTGQGSGSGLFNSPKGVAVDESGNVYVADTANYRIQKFNTDGVFLLQWSYYSARENKYDIFGNITVDGSGNVYATSEGLILKFDASGAFLAQWGNPGSANGEMNNPRDIAVDRDGNVYVADTYNHRIQKFSSNGTYLAQWGSLGKDPGQFNSPSGIDVDSSGNVYVADTGNHRIQMFSTNGTFLAEWGSQGNNLGQFESPWGIAVDANGIVYIADSGNHRIQEFNAAGN